MNAELLAMLGGAGLPGPSSNRREEEGKTILTFKAGRMDPVLQPNGKFLITADPRRGQLSLLYTLTSSSSSSILKLEWKDRRTRTVVESFTIIPEDRCTFAPIPTGREGERVYLLQFGSNTDRRFFFWMQDKFETGVDEKNCYDMNKFLSNVNECIIAAGGEPPAQPSSSSSTGAAAGSDSTTTAPSPSGATTANTAPSSSATSQQQQVDALSNILENLGMPQPNSNNSSSADSSSAPTGTSTSAPSTTPSANTSSGGVLTLADLQGAMAGLATHSPTTANTNMTGNPQLHHPTPPLTELATSDAVEESGILEDKDVVARLMEYLPEGQRTEEMLRENLRSPQVQQALHSLTMALVGDSSDDGEGGSMESYHSIIANFQLDAEDGAAAMASGNPIQAFLDCLLANMEKKKKDDEEKSEE